MVVEVDLILMMDGEMEIFLIMDMVEMEENMEVAEEDGLWDMEGNMAEMEDL